MNPFSLALLEPAMVKKRSNAMSHANGESGQFVTTEHNVFVLSFVLYEHGPLQEGADLTGCPVRPCPSANSCTLCNLQHALVV